MKILLNGKEEELKYGLTVEGLLKKLDLDERLVAVEINESIVKKEDYGGTMLNENDRVEIVHLVGGG